MLTLPHKTFTCSTTSTVFPPTVWLTDLFIYYFISPSFGEEWSEESYFLIAGILVLSYGMSIYNAPNAGSILLKGNWDSFGIDCTKEYEAISQEKEEAGAKKFDTKNLVTHESTLSTVVVDGSNSNGSSDVSDLSDLLVSLLQYEPIPEYEYETKLT